MGRCLPKPPSAAWGGHPLMIQGCRPLAKQGGAPTEGATRHQSRMQKKASRLRRDIRRRPSTALRAMADRPRNEFRATLETFLDARRCGTGFNPCVGCEHRMWHRQSCLCAGRRPVWRATLCRGRTNKRIGRDGAHPSNVPPPAGRTDGSLFHVRLSLRAPSTRVLH